MAVDIGYETSLQLGGVALINDFPNVSPFPRSPEITEIIETLLSPIDLGRTYNFFSRESLTVCLRNVGLGVSELELVPITRIDKQGRIVPNNEQVKYALDDSEGAQVAKCARNVRVESDGSKVILDQFAGISAFLTDEENQRLVSDIQSSLRVLDPILALRAGERVYNGALEFADWRVANLTKALTPDIKLRVLSRNTAKFPLLGYSTNKYQRLYLLAA